MYRRRRFGIMTPALITTQTFPGIQAAMSFLKKLLLSPWLAFLVLGLVLYAGMRIAGVHSLIMIAITSVLFTEACKLSDQSDKALAAMASTREKILRGKRPSYSYEELLRSAMKSYEHTLTEEGVRNDALKS